MTTKDLGVWLEPSGKGVAGLFHLLEAVLLRSEGPGRGARRATAVPGVLCGVGGPGPGWHPRGEAECRGPGQGELKSSPCRRPPAASGTPNACCCTTATVLPIHRVLSAAAAEAGAPRQPRPDRPQLPPMEGLQNGSLSAPA